MASDQTWRRTTDVPSPFRTAQRPGQPGDADDKRAGPSPLSAHPTGPHAPYEAGDHDGAAANKHVRVADKKPPEEKPRRAGALSENFSVTGGR